MPITRVGQFDVDCEDVGSGLTVLLVHSSASGNRQWRRLCDELAQRYRLLAINLFGYGATTRWPGDRPLTLGDAAELVAGLADLAPAPVALCGHSLGAAVALEAALRLGQRVRVLIAFEPILFYLLDANGCAAAAAEISALAARYLDHAAVADWPAAGELFVDYWSGPGTWAGLSDERRRGLVTLLPNVVHEWRAVISPSHTLGEWSAITAPTHLLRAADTRPPTYAIATLLATANPHWTLHEIATGGHMAPATRTDLVNPLIGRILDEAPQ